MPSKCKRGTKANKFAGCKKGTFIKYLENTPRIPKHMNTEQSARYILSGRSKTRFHPRTKRRARLVLMSIQKRRAAKRR